jgi:hypothetical protein
MLPYGGMSKRPAGIFLPPNKDIVQICEVDLSTAKRWRRGATCPPRMALKLLSGDLGAFDLAWKGWKVRKGELISPEGWSMPVSEVLAIPFLRQQLAVYQAEHRRLKNELECERTRLDEQPLPAEIPDVIG